MWYCMLSSSVYEPCVYLLFTPQPYSVGYCWHIHSSLVILIIVTVLCVCGDMTLLWWLTIVIDILILGVVLFIPNLGGIGRNCVRLLCACSWPYIAYYSQYSRPLLELFHCWQWHYYSEPCDVDPCNLPDIVWRRVLCDPIDGLYCWLNYCCRPQLLLVLLWELLNCAPAPLPDPLGGRRWPHSWHCVTNPLCLISGVR